MSGQTQKHPESVQREFVFAAAPSAYLLFSIVFGLLQLFLLYSWVKHPYRVGVGEFTPTLMLAFFILWLSRLRIHISESGLAYRSLFSTWSLAWAEIEDAEIRVGRPFSLAELLRFTPYVRLVIRLLPATGKRYHVINLKPFQGKDIAVLLNSPQLRLRHSHRVA